TAAAVKVQQIEREQQIKVQETEIVRRERELVATVLKPAEVERQRIETMASAEKMRLTAEAEGAAASTRLRGDAEADIIFKKGDAEARAMNNKAEAFQEYNQAAVLDRLLVSLPDVVAALATPLSKVDKITVISTGNGDAAGVNKITGDITKMAAQVPISIADQHMLEKKEKETGDKAADWLRKAELAIDRGQDDLARAALGRHKASERTQTSFREQVADQRAQVVTLKAAFAKLEQKLAEAQSKSDMLLAQHRRARARGEGSEGRVRNRR